jgi:hypothetical protein
MLAMSYYYFYFERGFAVMENDELKKLHVVFTKLTDAQKKNVLDLAEMLVEKQKTEISVVKKEKARVKGGK